MRAGAGRIGHIARHQYQPRLRRQPRLILRRTTPRGHLSQRQNQDSQRQTTGYDPWAIGAGDREKRRNAVHAAMIRMAWVSSALPSVVEACGCDGKHVYWRWRAQLMSAYNYRTKGP